MMAEAFGTSEEVINQTVTAYLVMQGICKQTRPVKFPLHQIHAV
jgi:hypothetical protein